MNLAIRPVKFDDERLGIILRAELSLLSQITPLSFCCKQLHHSVLYNKPVLLKERCCALQVKMNVFWLTDTGLDLGFR